MAKRKEVEILPPTMGMFDDMDAFVENIKCEPRIARILNAFDNTISSIKNFEELYEEQKEYAKKINGAKIEIHNVEQVNKKIQELMSISSRLNYLYIELSEIQLKFNRLWNVGYHLLRVIPNIKKLGKEPELFVFEDLYNWSCNVETLYDMISKNQKEINNVINNLELQQKNTQLDRWIGTTQNRVNKRDDMIRESNSDDIKLSAVMNKGVFKR